MDHILGDPNASIVVVEFSDLECPFCKNFESTMNSLLSTYGKSGQLAWVYRDFPLNIHPRSEKESEASECANELGGNDAFWKYTEAVFATTTSNNTLDPQKLPIIAGNIGLDVAKFNTCLSSGKYAALITDQTNDALAAGARGTPYSVMLLKYPLSSDAENNINNFVASNQLSGNVMISGDKKEIVINGALPLQLVKQVVDYILKK
jgi:protein-disulfide isomerase